jgi:tripartite ATP-independent transporter DctP family solute receptor
MSSFARRTILAGVAAALALPSIGRAQAAGRRLRLGHETVAETAFGQYAQAFAREVATRTGNRWTVEVFPNGALGGQLDMVRTIGSATLDLGVIAPISLGGQIPELQVFDVPFLFRDVAHAREVFDGPVAEAYRASWASKDLHLLGWGEFGVRHLTANRPIPNAAAMAGLRLRVPPSPLIVEVFRAMGAQPQALPWAQTFDALRTGAMDAHDNPIGLILGARINEVQSHLMLTGHTYTGFGLLASPEVMEDLSAEDRQHFAAAAEAAKAVSRATAERFDREGLSTLRQRGMTVIADPDIASFRAAREAAMSRISAAVGADALRRITG